MSPLKRLFRELGAAGAARTGWAAALAVVTALAEGVGLAAMAPLLALIGVGGTGAEAPALSLEAALALYAVVFTAVAVMVRERALTAARLRMAVVDGLRLRIHEAVLALEWRAFRTLKAAEVTFAATGEVGRVGLALEALMSLWVGLVSIPVLLVVTAVLSPVMTAATIGVCVLAYLLARPLHRASLTIGRDIGTAGAGLQSDFTDDMAGFAIIKGLMAERVRHAGFARRTQALREQQLAYVRATTLWSALTRVAAALAAAAGVVAAVRGFGMDVAAALVFVLAFARLLQAGLRVQDGLSRLLHALPALDRIDALLVRCHAAAEPPMPPSGTDEPPPFRHAVTLHRVTVTHEGATAPALAEIDLEIPAGSVVAVVGPSGAGKSTLADVLLGFLEPDSGRIAVDGIPLAGPARRAWRRVAAGVPQEAFLFHGTIRANLALAGVDGVEPEEAALWEALKAAAVADVVRALPQGLDTVVGDRGARLSGGERQRVALARTLLRRPRLLVLDEATSALDAASEQRVQAALEQLAGTVTLVVIAHRAATVRLADRVVVLERGRVVTSGRREDIAVHTSWLAQGWI